jgi:oxygen-independent coproporphyrinogen-3 oxidase
VGGGTPSHLRPAQLRRFFAILADSFKYHEDLEFTWEANPSDVDDERLAALLEAGVNRVSLGVQSLQDRKLALLERDHRRSDVLRVWERLRPRFPALNIDLIFAVPSETLTEWQRDLEQTLAIRPDHVSVYGLTVEKGARFYASRLRGELPSLSEESERALFEVAIDTLTAAEFEHYEVSNFCQAGYRCRHNEVYWTGRGYYAAGPGAARYVNGRREVNHRSVTTYIKRLQAGDSPVAERETLSPMDAAREQLVFSLRRLEGVNKRTFTRETGFSVAELAAAELASFVDQGLLEDGPEDLRLTRDGLLISDAIWPALLRV